MGVGVGSGGSFFGSDQIYVIMPVWEGAAGWECSEARVGPEFDLIMGPRAKANSGG